MGEGAAEVPKRRLVPAARSAGSRPRHPLPRQEGRRVRRGGRNRDERQEEEEEHGRRRAARPGAVARSVGRTRERERERSEKRERGGEKEKRKLLYIFDSLDSDEKREKLTKIGRSGQKQESASNDLGRQTRDRTAGGI